MPTLPGADSERAPWAGTVTRTEFELRALLFYALATAAAPLVDVLMAGRPRAQASLDGFVQVVVAGLLLVHVLPHAVADAGLAAILTFVGGAGVAALAHRLPGGERGALGLSGVALVAHGLSDGASLALPGDGGAALTEAVVLHTLPLALAIWRVARSRGGAGWAAFALALSVGATVAGFAASDAVLSGSSPVTLALAQCGAAGALLHVLGHLGHHTGGGPRGGLPSGVGALVGLAVVVALDPANHGHVAADESGLGASMVRLAARAAPALVAAYVAAALVQVLGRHDQPWINPATRRWLPFVRQVAAPLGPVAVLVSAALFGWVFVLVSAGVSVVAALVAAPSARRSAADRAPHRHEAWVLEALGSVVAPTAPGLLAGLGLAALILAHVPAGSLEAAGLLGAGIGAVLLGGPIPLGTAGAALVAFALVQAGLSAGGALVVVLVAPAARASALRALWGEFGGRAVAVWLLAVAAGAAVAGLTVDGLSAVSAPDGLAGGPISVVERVSIGVVAALLLTLLVGRGPARFFEPDPTPDHPETGGETT